MCIYGETIDGFLRCNVFEDSSFMVPIGLCGDSEEYSTGTMSWYDIVHILPWKGDN